MDLESLISEINMLRMLSNEIEPYSNEISICVRHKNSWSLRSDKLERMLPYGFNGDKETKTSQI